MKLSIVATLYQSSNYINEFYERISSAAKQLTNNDYEIILVNDGSPDNSLEKAVALAKTDSRLTIINLSRNFGHHKAMMTGLEHAQGDYVFLIDSDLEEQPEWLLEFNEKLHAESKDVIYGVQKSRRGGKIEQLTGNLFYKSFRALTGINQPDNIVTARLMTKDYVTALISHREREINIGGLWVITGFDQSSIDVDKVNSSKTTYSLSRKAKHLVNAITSFSNLPLVLAFYVGCGLSLVSGLYVINLIINYFFFSRPIDGYTSLIASIWLLSGLIIFFLGIQGIYLSKIFSEVKQRPNTIIKNIYSYKDK